MSRRFCKEGSQEMRAVTRGNLFYEAAVGRWQHHGDREPTHGEVVKEFGFTLHQVWRPP